jgi:hypothetical protein
MGVGTKTRKALILKVGFDLHSVAYIPAPPISPTFRSEAMAKNIHL